MASNSRRESTWCAAAMNASGTKITLIQRGLPGLLQTHEPAPSGLKRLYSTNGGSSWIIPSEDWNDEAPIDLSQIGEGVFNSGPAAAVSADGKKLHVFGRGVEKPSPPTEEGLVLTFTPHIWRAFSSNGGVSWDLAWKILSPGYGPI